MKVFLSVLLSMVVLASVAEARSCYSQAEAEAEQGIRIHSELMVIGLNCQHMTPRGWQNFYSQYRSITKKHEDLFSNYEKTLINYYRQNGVSNPERKMHDLRTAFANKVSTDAAQMRPDVFCATYAPRIPRAAKMTKADFQQWASTFHPSHPLERPVCN
ncbi:MAG: hypothetical protein AAF988_05310 [Pseudomonadota bacterium]